MADDALFCVANRIEAGGRYVEPREQLDRPLLSASVPLADGMATACIDIDRDARAPAARVAPVQGASVGRDRAAEHAARGARLRVSLLRDGGAAVRAVDRRVERTADALLGDGDAVAFLRHRDVAVVREPVAGKRHLAAA